MDEFIAKFAESQGFISLIAAGVIFVIVNTLSHAIQQLYNERRNHKQIVERAISPLLNVTSDLISRIGEILVFQRPSMLDSLQMHNELTLQGLVLDEQTQGIRPEALDRLQSTAYRLLRFLVFVHQFYRATADTPPFSRLRHANYFLQRKISTSLKGNFYHAPLLSKEMQENIGSELLDSDGGRSAADFNVGHFCKLIRKGVVEVETFRQAMAVFSVDPLPIKEHSDIDHHSANWRKLIALAHLGVYLVDFFQDLSYSPRWEEYRVFFVALIRNWNQNAVAPRYLYESGDLDSVSTNYIDTFSERLAWRHPLYRLERLLPQDKALGSLKLRYRRYIKSRVLIARGARYVGVHHKKDVLPWGVRIYTKNVEHDIYWTRSVASVHIGICNYLRSEGMIGEAF